MKSKTKKILSGLIAVSMLCTAIPVYTLTEVSAEDRYIWVNQEENIYQGTDNKRVIKADGYEEINSPVVNKMVSAGDIYVKDSDGKLTAVKDALKYTVYLFENMEAIVDISVADELRAGISESGSYYLAKNADSCKITAGDSGEDYAKAVEDKYSTVKADELNSFNFADTELKNLKANEKIASCHFKFDAEKVKEAEYLYINVFDKSFDYITGLYLGLNSYIANTYSGNYIKSVSDYSCSIEEMDKLCIHKSTVNHSIYVREKGSEDVKVLVEGLELVTYVLPENIDEKWSDKEFENRGKDIYLTSFIRINENTAQYMAEHEAEYALSPELFGVNIKNDKPSDIPMESVCYFKEDQSNDTFEQYQNIERNYPSEKSDSRVRIYMTDYFPQVNKEIFSPSNHFTMTSIPQALDINELMHNSMKKQYGLEESDIWNFYDRYIPLGFGVSMYNLDNETLFQYDVLRLEKTDNLYHNYVAPYVVLGQVYFINSYYEMFALKHRGTEEEYKTKEWKAQIESTDGSYEGEVNVNLKIYNNGLRVEVTTDDDKLPADRNFTFKESKLVSDDINNICTGIKTMPVPNDNIIADIENNYFAVPLKDDFDNKIHVLYGYTAAFDKKDLKADTVVEILGQKIELGKESGLTEESTCVYDCYGDGIINIFDFMCLKSYLLGDKESMKIFTDKAESENVKIKTDVNNDGHVNVIDLLRLKTYFLEN